MSKVKLPFSVPESDFVPAEFVPTSEVEGVPPRIRRNQNICGCGECDECEERVKQYRRDTAEIRIEWQKQRKRKMREMELTND